ncbi:HAD superfamily hydrolase [Bifidobacterium minimum]|uniref:phosphomannomutase n=1 Tax=Bifidobacterium minimum TaxID=1693 RepID=A0A087BQI3_9BIFI|nr:HAD-IIB family hydrolase [Bifidobacterium minimum]KFI73283.1 HAD superfamily hydrolase [Bifidobacterium minimum]
MAIVHDPDVLASGHGPESIGAVGFDLDNTLARSKRPMTPLMASKLAGLTRMRTVAVVTGGSFSLVRSQIIDVLPESTARSSMIFMPTSGTRCYGWDGERWDCMYSHDLSEADRAAAIESLTRHAKEQGIWEEHVWGERIEDRGSQITFSALGQLAPPEAKERWDPDNSRKNRLADAVASDLPHLEVRSGGSTSVDVSDRGIDKAYAVRRLADICGIGVTDIVFVGDRMDPGGNDYPVAEAGVFAIRVSGPEQTLHVCDDLLAILHDGSHDGS